MNELRKQLDDALTVEFEEGGDFTGQFELSEDFTGFQGHFPGEPVMPGMSIVIAVLVAAERACGRALTMTRLKFAKFYSPVKPGERVVIEGNVDCAGSPCAINAALRCGERRVAKVRVQAMVETSNQE